MTEQSIKNPVYLFLSRVIYDIFLTSFSVYIVAFFLEAISKGIVVQYFNLNSILVMCVVSGTVTIIFPTPPSHDKSQRLFTYLTALFVVVTTLVVYSVSRSLGFFAVPFSLAAGCVTYFFLSVVPRIHAHSEPISQSAS